MQKKYTDHNLPTITGAKVAVVQAAWHREYTDKMILAFTERLHKAGCDSVEQHLVPGCYEVPLAAKLLAKKHQFDAIAVFGAILKGETDHYEVILQTCIRELGRVMYEFEIPVIMELMPISDIAQLAARSQGEHNKGIEAAIAAAEMISWTRENKKS